MEKGEVHRIEKHLRRARRRPEKAIGRRAAKGALVNDEVRFREERAHRAIHIVGEFPRPRRVGHAILIPHEFDALFFCEMHQVDGVRGNGAAHEVEHIEVVHRLGINAVEMREFHASALHHRAAFPRDRPAVVQHRGGARECERPGREPPPVGEAHRRI